MHVLFRDIVNRISLLKWNYNPGQEINTFFLVTIGGIAEYVSSAAFFLVIRV